MICVVHRHAFNKVAVHQHGVPGFLPPIGTKVFVVLPHEVKINHWRQVF